MKGFLALMEKGLLGNHGERLLSTFLFHMLDPSESRSSSHSLCFDSGLELIPSQWKMSKRRKGKK